MPDLFHAVCNSCGYDEISHRSISAVVPATGEVVELCHPLEDSLLREAGESWSTVGWHGRFLKCNACPCRNCGMTYLRRVFDFPFQSSCIGSIGIGCLYFVACILTNQSIPVILFALPFGTSVGIHLVAFLLRIIAVGAAAMNHIRITDIPCCEAPSLMWGPLWRWTKFPCPRCKVRSLKYSLEGGF